MKKSSIIGIFILALLAAASIYIYKSKNKSSTLDKKASDFAVKDTASIDKIFLADKDNKSVLVEKTDKGWKLNGKHDIRPDVIDLLLYTIRMVEVSSPVSKSSRENVIKVMSSKSTKVEIYSKGKKIKQYFVGHPTQDHLGTYMLLTNLNTGDNYEEPFITHIPGFDGFLSTRYNTEELDWRARLVLDFTPPKIKQIKMDLHEFPDSSFVIDLFSLQRFGLRINKTNQSIPFDEERIKQFIAYFQNVNCEVVLDKQNALVDSLAKSAVPFATLTIIDRENKPNTCEFFHKQPNISKNEQYGVEYKYDPDRLFIRYDNGKEYGVAQYYVFGKILQTYQYFVPKK
jgi:hypothetical protein